MSRIFYLTIIKITGSWEGYVPISTDLYYKGANTANFKFGAVLGYKQNGSVAFDTAQIHAKPERVACMPVAVYTPARHTT